MQLFLKILNAMANSVDPDQTASSCHFVRNFGVQNFRIFSIYRSLHKGWSVDWSVGPSVCEVIYCYRFL